MNVVDSLAQSVVSFFKQQFSFSQGALSRINFVINTDLQKLKFGDLTTNAAMILAKELNKNPRDIADIFVKLFKDNAVEDIAVAGPGFINITLTGVVLHQLVQSFVNQSPTIFRPRQCSARTTNIEFVSANPTGPLHFGHGRGGIIGDVFSRVLRFIGQPTTREFYINDAGAQIQKLGASFKIRCLELLGNDVKLPEDAYHGTYLKEMAEKLIASKGSAVLEEPDTFFSNYAKIHLLAEIKATLSRYRVDFDVWFSEQQLHKSEMVEKAIGELRQKGHVFEKDGAVWFHSTAFGDDKDRVLKRADGTWTYAAADVAYLVDKASRGFDHLVMILGQDHHSYAVRLQNFIWALELRTELQIIFYQLVHMNESGKRIQMSKRTGKMITLSDVMDDVGVDAARFFYLYRKADAQLEFDLDLARKKSNENPVYYVQYAYVRTGSIAQKAHDAGIMSLFQTEKNQEISGVERLLIRKMAQLERVLFGIGQTGLVHTLAYYAVELSDIFHSFYNSHRVIEPSDIAKTQWRLAMVYAVRNTLAVCLDLMGISKPSSM